MPEGEKRIWGPIVIGDLICPPPVGIGWTDLLNIGGGGSGLPGPPVPVSPKLGTWFIMIDSDLKVPPDSDHTVGHSVIWRGFDIYSDLDLLLP